MMKSKKPEEIYPVEEISASVQRISDLKEKFKKEFSSDEGLNVFSVAGRIEVGGNHTDHQLGKVLCATIHSDTLAVAKVRDDKVVRILSEGYPLITVDLSEIQMVKEEENTTAALVRGVAYKLKEQNFDIGGFDAVVTSNVLKGSGMSSSASFEGLLGIVFNEFFCQNQVKLMELAKIGQYAENVYFGKPSGLMDQIACILGGFIYIDFYDKENPKIEKIDPTFLANVYDVCIIDTGDAHSDLTQEYTDITLEMQEISQFFGEDYLSRVKEDDFYEKLPVVKEKFGDRAILRAIHFFQDNRMVEEECKALREEDLEKFLQLVKASGRSSVANLQNIYAISQPQVQGASIILALCQKLLGDFGAYRIHGGGFGGTVQAFVPKGKTAHFKTEIEKVMGKDSCHVVAIRCASGAKVI
ncbi:MAG: galactokinase family protein [Eubacteriales bacterium]